MSPALALEFFLLAALWGSSFLFMRLGAAEFGALPTAGLRVALAALFLLPVFLVKGVWADFRQRAKPILFVGLLNSGIPFALFAFAVMHITTGLTSILNATVPLGRAGGLALAERPAERLAHARSADRLCGRGLLVVGKSGFSATGVAGGADAGTTCWPWAPACWPRLCYGMAASFTKRYLTGAHPLATATGSQIGAALGLALPTSGSGPQQPVSLSAWGALAAVALFVHVHRLHPVFSHHRQGGPSRALTVTFLVPVFALMYGAFSLAKPSRLDGALRSRHCLRHRAVHRPGAPALAGACTLNADRLRLPPSAGRSPNPCAQEKTAQT
jgi:hypothetical protein